MLATFSKKAVRTSAGLYLGEVGALEIDATRLENVLSRIIRGLFFFHTGKRLPTDYHIWVCVGWFPQDSAELISSVKELFGTLCSQPIYVIGDCVFRYSYLKDGDDPNSSAWWLSFYEHRHFIGVTSQNNYNPRPLGGEGGAHRAG